MSRVRAVKLFIIMLVVAFVALWAWHKRRDAAASRASWTDPGQPAEGVAAAPTALTAEQSWAANRCRPMVASCDGYTAGRRVRKLYPASLTDCPETVVRAELGVNG